MAWMKLDDQFHASRKLNSIPKRHRFQAAGLWAIAGSWVAGQGTDGFVPEYMIKAWGPTSKTVEALVEADLWHEAPGGYCFVAWLEYNPSKAQTEAERAASAERMRRSRERRKGESKSNRVDSDHEQSTNEARTERESTTNVGHSDRERDASSGHSDIESGEQFSVSADHGDSGEDVAAQQSEVLRRNAPGVLQRPDPTRPDPTHKEGEVVSKGEVVGEWAQDTQTPSGAVNSVVDAGLDRLAAERPRRGTPDEWSTPEDPRCQAHAHLSREDVPACGKCAQARQWFTQQDEQRKAKQQQIIDECGWCDDRGMADVGEGRTPLIVKCNHLERPRAPEREPEAKPDVDLDKHLAKVRPFAARPEPVPESTQDDEHPENDQPPTALPKTGTGPF